MRSPALLALRSKRIAHEFEQFVERSELNVVGSSAEIHERPSPSDPPGRREKRCWVVFRGET
jgi:hypothetical protein